MTAFSIVQISTAQFSLYDSIPSQFLVKSIYRVENMQNGPGGLTLVEEPVKNPFTRDYNFSGIDIPTTWAQKFDMSNWGIFITLAGEQPIGGCAIALDGDVFPVREMQRKDLAIVWDIRVRPAFQRQGVGTLLFLHAANWSKEQGYGQLGLETDTSNVPACKFYTHLGCELGAILKYGYSGIPEVATYAMLLWYLNLITFNAPAFE